MIKWTAAGKDGRKGVGLGITERNVKELKKGNPIVVNGDELGLIGVDIMIHYGATEAAIVMSMRNAGVETPLQRRDVTG